MSHPARPRWVVALILVSLVLSGCTIAVPGLQRSAGPTASGSVGAQFAEFDPAAHEQWPDRAAKGRPIDTSSTVKPPGFTDPPSGQGRGRYVDQRLEWESCGDHECATVVVPLDWDQPDGQAITLAMTRRPAVAGEQRLGSLFLNPGGPGMGGQSMVTEFDDSVLPGYDVIGWDPRGTGESTPIRCGDTQALDAWNQVESSVVTPSQWEDLIAANRTFGQGCRAESGSLLDHVSTIDTVRDLDYLRYLVGDPKLNYLGISYGTYLGAMYAELYPQRAGRLVLDSAVNITDDESVSQAMGFELAFTNFLKACLDQGCSLGSSQQQIRTTIMTYLDQLRTTPVQALGRGLNASRAVAGIAAYLYFGEQAYPQLEQVLRDSLSGADASGLQAGADMLSGRERHGYSPLASAFPAIVCADWGDLGIAGEREAWLKQKAKAPLFGLMGPGLTCPLWTAKPTVQLKLTAKTAPPILVLGVTGDPATPYQYAVSMAKQLKSGILLSYEGAGHSAWSVGNECIRHQVTAFLTSGTKPTTERC